MFDSINEMETQIIYLLSGLILFLSSLSAFIVFICYRELRHGIYGMVLGTTASEAYIGLHSLISAIYSIYRNNTTPINMVYCKVEATLTVFFWTFWMTLNLCIMILFVKRKLEHSKLSRILFLFSTFFSITLSALLYMNDAIGLSFSGTCFIKKNTDFSTAVFASLFYLVFISSIILNIWFFFCRDSSKDRNFINGYNYFLLITSILSFFLNTYLLLLCFFDIDSIVLYYFSIIMTPICFIYISAFRIKIEYVQIMFSTGPTRYKSCNCLLFFLGMAKKPKFKEIKKVLNVKYVENTGRINDADETIYSQIMKNSSIL